MDINTYSAVSSTVDSLASQVQAAFVNNQPFTFTIPVAGTPGQDPSGSPEQITLSGKFNYEELEPVGDNSLFTPGDPNAPDAGKQAFIDSLLNFITMATKGAQQGNSIDSHITTSTSYVGDGGQEELKFGGSFSLQEGPVGSTGNVAT